MSGSYLAAMTLLATISGTEPQETPGHLVGREILRGGTLATTAKTLCDLRVSDVRRIEEAVRLLAR